MVHIDERELSVIDFKYALTKFEFRNLSFFCV